MTGLALIPWYIIPHDDSEIDSAVDSFRDQHKLTDDDIFWISDESGVFVDSSELTLDIVI